MSEPFRHVLVAYDGSSESRLALDRAIEVARTSSSRLTIVTVHQPPVVWATGFMIPPEPPGPAERKALEDVLRLAVQTAKDQGLPDARGELLENHPAEAILSLAEQEHADLIVMGSRGRSVAPRLLLGSVSDAVVHHAHVAVLVVRAPAKG